MSTEVEVVFAIIFGVLCNPISGQVFWLCRAAKENAHSFLAVNEANEVVHSLLAIALYTRITCRETAALLTLNSNLDIFIEADRSRVGKHNYC